jgi:hypothetical protein
MTKPTANPDDSALGRTLWAVAVVGCTATVVAAVIAGPRPMLSVALGAAVAFTNLWVIARLVRSFLSGGARAPWGFVAATKFVLVVGGLWLLLRAGVVDLLPLVIGYGALPLGIFASQLGASAPARERG